MSFWDAVDFFSNLLILGGDKSERNRPVIFIFFYILIVLGIFLFAIELTSITNLRSPILFLGLFVTIGITLTFGIIILFFRLNLIEQIKRKDFFTILIPIILLTISLASFMNRNYGFNKQNLIVKTYKPIHKENSSSVLVNLNGEEIRMNVPKHIGKLQDSDLLKVERRMGLMGFEIIYILNKVQ